MPERACQRACMCGRPHAGGGEACCTITFVRACALEYPMRYTDNNSIFGEKNFALFIGPGYGYHVRYTPTARMYIKEHGL